MAAPRLDKDHGFIRFIVNNQIDRDNYEQEQKVLKYRKALVQKNKKQYREERRNYVPPNSTKPAAARPPKHNHVVTNSNSTAETASQRGMYII